MSPRLMMKRPQISCPAPTTFPLNTTFFNCLLLPHCIRHRENYIRNMRTTISRTALILSKLLEHLIWKKLNRNLTGQSRVPLPPAPAGGVVMRYHSAVAIQLANYANCLNRLFPTSPAASSSSGGGVERHSSSEFALNCYANQISVHFDARQIATCIDKATPFELLTSRLIPAFTLWMKVRDHLRA